MYSGRIETFAKRISHALSLKGMKQSELCARAKVPKSSLSLYLSGAYEPRQDRIYDMATILDVDPVWLMGYDVPMEREEKNISTNELQLTDGEKMLLELFRKIPEEHQPQALEMLRVALKMQKKL